MLESMISGINNVKQQLICSNRNAHMVKMLNLKLNTGYICQAKEVCLRSQNFNESSANDLFIL